MTPSQAQASTRVPFNPSTRIEQQAKPLANPYTPLAHPPNFESLRQHARYQDLTHEEAQKLRTQRDRQLLLDRRTLWLKSQGLPDPAREAKKLQRDRRNNQEPSEEDNILDRLMTSKESARLDRMEAEAEQKTLESRLRAKVRNEKLASSAIINAPIPSGEHLDPIKRHIERRKERIQVLMRQVIEEILSHNSTQILEGMLGGASVSVVRIESDNFRKRQMIYVTVSSEHDKEWVLKQLNITAPKLRSQLAVKLNLGHTPELAFALDHDVKTFHKGRLHDLAQGAELFKRNFEREMNW